MGASHVVYQSNLRAHHKQAFGTLVGEHIWKVLRFNMFLEIASVTHDVLADPIVKRPSLGG